MSTMHAVERFASDVVSAHDVACSATRHTRSDEEAAPAPTLVIPRRGVFRWRASGDDAIADPNVVLLFDEAQPHCITHPTDDGDDCTALRYSAETVREAFGDAPRSRHWILSASMQAALHRALLRVRRPADALDAEEAAMSILSTVCGAAEGVRRPHRAVDIVRERIAADPSNRARLSDLASGSGLSPYELARRFRASTGSSIHQYRTRLRLLTALSRVHDGEDDFSALALDLGFSSHSHFTFAFTRAFGSAPRAVRALSQVRVGSR